MKTYRSEQHGFAIDVPDEWLLPRGESIRTRFGHSVEFWCGAPDRGFNIQIGQTVPETLDQTEDEFRRYAKTRQYTGLEFGRVTVEGKEHIWARYRMGTGDWAKKYLITFGEVEYAITANCFERQEFTERERVWDEVVKSFKLTTPAKPQKITKLLGRARRAARLFERGYSCFRRGKYQKALRWFEEGKKATGEFPWNSFGVAMTLLQMIEAGKIPDGEIAFTLAMAEKNLQQCLLISPREQDYLDAMKAIQDLRAKYGI